MWLRLGLFALMLLCIWLPIVGVARLLIFDANTFSIVVMTVLFIEFFVLLWVWVRHGYQERVVFRRYGLDLSRLNQIEFIYGLLLGLGSLVLLLMSQAALGWLVLRSPNPGFGRIVVEGLLVALGISACEELIFRGWIFDELCRDFRRSIALWGSTLSYAVLHFIRPLNEILYTAPQFIGLLVLGLALGWAKLGNQGRIGGSIGLHTGLVWGFYMANVGNMIHYNPSVSEWLTGINQNPLAGIAGLSLLGAIAGWMRRRYVKQRQFELY